MAQDKTNTSDPLVAMGQTDGWSTTQPITISFTGKNLDPATAANGFYLIKSGDPTNPDDTTQPTRLTQQAGDFVVKASGDSLIVILLKPLDPASNYMFAVTDDLKDVNGQAVGMSNSYALLKSDNLPPATALLQHKKSPMRLKKLSTVLWKNAISSFHHGLQRYRLVMCYLPPRWQPKKRLVLGLKTYGKALQLQTQLLKSNSINYLPSLNL